MAARLLDPADKVPSFCPEQELTPEESEFRSPVGGGLGLSEDPPHWPGPAPWTPWAGAVPSVPASPTAPAGSAGAPGWRALAGKLFWRQTLEHQGRNSRSAVPRESPPPRSLRLDTPGTGEGRRPTEPVPGEPPGMLSPGVVALLPALQTPVAEEAPHLVLLAWGGAKTLVLTTPGPLHGLVCPPRPGLGAPRWPFLLGQGLSGVACEPRRLPLASATPLPSVLRIHVYPIFSTVE